MEAINLYRFQLPPVRGGCAADFDTLLCVACASREQRPLALLRPEPGRMCLRCGLDGPRAHTLTVPEFLDGLVVAVEAARAQLAGQPEWIEELDDAYDWALQFDGQIITDGHIVLIPSDGTPGLIYSVNGACQCESYQHRANPRHDRACKHRVRAKLVKRAILAQAELLSVAAAALSQAELDARYAESLREVNELFPS